MNVSQIWAWGKFPKLIPLWYSKYIDDRRGVLLMFSFITTYWHYMWFTGKTEYFLPRARLRQLPGFVFGVLFLGMILNHAINSLIPRDIGERTPGVPRRVKDTRKSEFKWGPFWEDVKAYHNLRKQIIQENMGGPMYTPLPNATPFSKYPSGMDQTIALAKKYEPRIQYELGIIEKWIEASKKKKESGWEADTTNTFRGRR